MNGDIALSKRWRQMLQEQAKLPLPGGMDRALFEYISQAMQFRLSLLAKYLTPEDLQRIDFTLDPEWRALGERAEQLMAAGDAAKLRRCAPAGPRVAGSL